MPHFRYMAKDSSGKSVSAVMEAQDEKSLTDSLRQQGMIIISVVPEKAAKARGGAAGSPAGGRAGGKIKLSELVLFSRQLATMIDSGIPLMSALEIMTEQIEHKGFRATVQQVKESVGAGSSFYEALAKHPKAFSPLFVHMVKAGESSGALDDIMDRLAGYLEKTDHLIRKVKAAMVYPLVVSTMAVLITLVLMIKVVPVFKTMFQDFGGELPMPTQILISISDFLIHYFLVWVSVVVITTILVTRFIKTEKGKLLFDGFKLKMPVFGILMKKVAVSKFSRTLSTLVKSGVPILAALEIVGKTSGNKVIENAVARVRVSIREGENITDPLIKSKVFPPLVCRMISVGEQSGELEKMLTKIADFYDDQVDAAVSGITSLIEPLVIAFLGIVIGGIVICMFLPIFKISTLVT